MSRTSYRGEVRFERGEWRSCGRFDDYPSLGELRTAAWNVAASRPRGTPLPIQVRVVTVTENASNPYPFQESEATDD